MENYYHRNLGFWSKEEQEKIRGSHVAIAGAGGDGFQLGMKLSMMGVESFSVADPEVFEHENSNRVLGATALAVGLNKAEVFRERVLELRPDAKIKVFTDGVTEDNIEDFIEGADLVVDETELTYPHIGTMIARRARHAGIPTTIVMNIGFAGIATSLNPQSRYWTFERMMGIPKDMPLDEIKEMGLDFGHALPYLPSYGDISTLEAVLDGAPLPSITQGVDVASGIGSTEAFLHLVGGSSGGNYRKEPTWNPRWRYYDAYANRAGTVNNIAKVGYYKSLAKVVFRNGLDKIIKPLTRGEVGLNPDCDYHTEKVN